MQQKRVLIADADPQAEAEFRNALGGDWEIIAAASGPAALAAMDPNPCDVVIACLDLPELEGAELLNRIRRKYSRAIRFIAARESDRDRVLKEVRGAHQFLAKPYDQTGIREAIDRAEALEAWVGSERLRELISRIRALPTVPTLYLEVVAALRSPDVTTEQVGAIIAKDLAMMTKLLQVVNSACFGASRHITDPAEAVGRLGFDTVKSMVMTIKLLNKYDKVKTTHFSVERLWRHSSEVARSARQLTLAETADPALAEAAFTAGLMHDLGKVVLASSFQEQYQGALLLSFKQGVPAWEIEMDLFGASHGEVGAYLLGLWGMPLNVVEAAALHHHPSGSKRAGFSPLTAVHVANVLEHEVNPDELGLLAPKLDEAYLDQMGLLGRVECWREAVASQDFSKAALKMAPMEAPKASVAESPMASAPEPPELATVQPQSMAAGSFRNRKWIYAGLVATVIAGLALAATFFVNVSSQPPLASNLPTNDTPQGTVADVANAQSPPSVPETPPATEPPPTNTPAAPAPVAVSAPSVFPALVVRARTASTETNAAPGAGKSGFKLQGMLFSPKDPVVIINGKTLHKGDLVDGARVQDITLDAVTLSYNNQRVTLKVK